MVRFACPRSAAVVLLCTLAWPSPAAAQETASPSLREAAAAASGEDDAQKAPAAPDAFTTPRQHRPSALVPLYVSFGALQVLDTHSTSRALGRGGVEANPVMNRFAGNEAGMIAVKAAGTAGVIYVSEKMWKKNRTAAVVFMIATNAAMAWVVQHNYRAVR
jgi:hypothetical protein